MKKYITTLVLVLLHSLASFAQDTESVLRELDAVISKKEQYRKNVQHRIDSLKHISLSANDSYKIEVYEKLFDCYNNYQVDSALLYIDKLLSIPEVRNDYYKNIMVNLKKSITYGMMGDFCSAMTIVDTIDVSRAPVEVRNEYYHTCRTVYGWNAEYVRSRRNDDDYFERLTQMYRDSILNCTEKGIRRSIVLADNCIVNGDAEAAVNILLEVLPKAEAEQKNYAYYNLAECYRIMGDTDRHIYFLALTAIADIRNGVTEYVALPELASLMYENGNISRAYTYLFCSMEDAHFCNAFLRTIKVNNIFPIIDKEYREHENKNKLFEHVMLSGVSFLSIILILGVFYLQRQMKRMNVIRKKLAEANQDLGEANSKLATANAQLEDVNAQLQGYNSQLGESNDELSKANTYLELTNKVREEYIAHYLEMCRSYMDTFDKQRKTLLRLAKNNQHQEILKMLKSGDIVEEEQRKFYSDFDKSFLSLHPDFIRDFNALLEEEFQLIPKKGELLSPELRIFALIRLGVDDSSMIAHFLNYSMPTIYNYRSRVRNHAICDKDEFYEKLMAIA